MKHRIERISNTVIEHSSRGTFTAGDKKHKPRLLSGGHGEENLQALKKYVWDYNIVAKYPNGVRLGNIPSHKKPRNQNGTWQVWFPKSWTRKTIKKAGEKTINSIPYKLPDGYHNPLVNVIHIKNEGILCGSFQGAEIPKYDEEDIFGHD